MEGDYGAHRQSCSAQERWPGLWQVPVWRLTELGGPFQMDPGLSYSGLQPAHGGPSAYDILKANFDAAYTGNRAPMPVYVHSFFLRAGNNLQDVQRFLGAWRAALACWGAGWTAGTSASACCS